MKPTKTPHTFALLHFASFLALSTIIAATAIPAWFGQGEITLEHAAILFARDVRAVQNHAVITGHDIEFEFLPEGDGYRAVDELGRAVILYSDGIPLARRYNMDGVFQGVRVHSITLEKRGPLKYNSNGFALNGGQIILSLGEEHSIITISPESGWVSIEGLSKPWRDGES
jgi:hypothetical protein